VTVQAHTMTEGNPFGNTSSNGCDSGMRLFTHLLQQELYNTIVLHPFILGEVVVKQFFTTIFLFDISQEEQSSVYKV
jgi:hypothetical protein